MLETIYDIACSMPFAICLTWFTILTLEYRTNDPAKKMLTMFAAVCSVLYLCHAITYIGGSNKAVDTIWMACSLSCFPVYWLYIKRVTKSETNSIRDYWVLIPAATISLLSLIMNVTLAEKVIALITILLVCIFGYLRLTRYDKEVSNYYSDTSERSTKPILKIMTLLILASIGAASLNIIGRATFNHSLIIIIPASVFSILLFAVLYNGSRLVYTVNEVKKTEGDSNIEELTESQEENLMSRINRLMKEKKLYTIKGLKITDISSELATNRTYVSKSINESTGKSFSSYVNEMRIEYAKELLRDNKSNMTISEIADMCGFSNEASFYRNFKLYTSVTPADWLEQAEK